jgi:TonB family protein
MASRYDRFPWKPIAIAAVLSMFLHLQLVFTDVLPFLWSLTSSNIEPTKPSQPTHVGRVALSRAQWEANRLLGEKKNEQSWTRDKASSATTVPEEKKDEKQEKNRESMNGQVVDVAPTGDDTPPENAKFLSDHNTRVQKETVSRYRRQDYGVAQPRPTVANLLGKNAEEAAQKGDSDITLLSKKRGPRDGGDPKQENAASIEIPDVRKRDPLQLKLDLALGGLPAQDGSDSMRGNSNRLRLGFGKADKETDNTSGDEGNSDQTVSIFQHPSKGNLSMVTGAPSNDHLPGVEEGEETLINTKEFKYATFFNRIKRGVSNHWNPGEVYMRHDPYGNIYGVKDRYTILSVELDINGALKDVSVSRSSGLSFLDDEAIHAFQEASPFPNPPKGLLDESGRILFQFGFYFEIGESPAFKIYRSNQPPMMY